MAINPFLRQNKKTREPIEVYVSDLFVDEEGKPVPFILKILSAEEADQLRDRCVKPKLDNKTRRKVGEEIDQEELQNQLLVKSIIQPDLSDKELQKSWGANSEIDLLTKMLDVKERLILLREYDKKFESSGNISEDAERETKND